MTVFKKKTYHGADIFSSLTVCLRYAYAPLNATYVKLTVSLRYPYGMHVKVDFCDLTRPPRL